MLLVGLSRFLTCQVTPWFSQWLKQPSFYPLPDSQAKQSPAWLLTPVANTSCIWRLVANEETVGRCMDLNWETGHRSAPRDRCFALGQERSSPTALRGHRSTRRSSSAWPSYNPTPACLPPVSPSPCLLTDKFRSSSLRDRQRIKPLSLPVSGGDITSVGCNLSPFLKEWEIEQKKISEFIAPGDRKYCFTKVCFCFVHSKNSYWIAILWWAAF